MSESYRHARGRKVISRSTANELGTLSHLLVSVDGQRIEAVILGKGRKARLVDWPQLSGFGADVVMVNDEAAVRSAANDREIAAAAGKLDLLGKRALAESGNELGTVDDVTFEPTDGTLIALDVRGRQLPAESVLGVGSYAVVLADSHDAART